MDGLWKGDSNYSHEHRKRASGSIRMSHLANGVFAAINVRRQKTWPAYLIGELFLFLSPQWEFLRRFSIRWQWGPIYERNPAARRDSFHGRDDAALKSSSACSRLMFTFAIPAPTKVVIHGA